MRPSYPFLLILLWGVQAIAATPTAQDQIFLYLEQRFLSETNRLCDSADPSSIESRRDALAQLDNRHSESAKAGEQLLREALLRKAKPDATLQRIEGELHDRVRSGLQQALSGAPAYCREIGLRAKELAGLSTSEIAVQNFNQVLRQIEHTQGMQCSQVGDKLRHAAVDVLRKDSANPGSAQLPSVDVYLLTRLEKINKAAKNCVEAGVLAAQRGILMPGDFERFAALSYQLLQTQHPLMLLGRSDKDEVVRLAKENAATFVAEAPFTE